MLRPIGDTILFVFKDKASSKGFENQTQTGITYYSFEDSLNTPRWGIVLAVGNKVKDIKPGMTVLIEPLRWTEGFTYDGVKIWKTVEKEIIAIKED